MRRTSLVLRKYRLANRRRHYRRRQMATTLAALLQEDIFSPPERACSSTLQDPNCLSRYKRIGSRAPESFARILSGRNVPCLGSSPDPPPNRWRAWRTGPGEKIQSLPNAEDDGAIRLRATQPRSRGLGNPLSFVQTDLFDCAAVKTRAEGAEPHNPPGRFSDRPPSPGRG